jgi:hypothetical protein
MAKLETPKTISFDRPNVTAGLRYNTKSRAFETRQSSHHKRGKASDLFTGLNKDEFPEDTTYRDFGWGRIDTPDCANLKSDITLFSTGQWNYAAWLYSDDPGSDAWGVEFHFLQNGMQIWVSRWYYSNTINSGNPGDPDFFGIWYEPFPGYLYNWVDSINMHYRC